MMTMFCCVFTLHANVDILTICVDWHHILLPNQVGVAALLDPLVEKGAVDMSSDNSA